MMLTRRTLTAVSSSLSHLALSRSTTSLSLIKSSSPSPLIQQHTRTIFGFGKAKAPPTVIETATAPAAATPTATPIKTDKNTLEEHARRNNQKELIEGFRVYLKKNPKDTEIFERLTHILLVNSKFQEALEIVEVALEHEAIVNEANMLKGTVLMALGR